MREIKFRFWKNDSMWYDFDGWVEDFSTNGHFEYFQQNKIPVMQYTGFNDKNGKEIYEGDIVLVNGHKCLIQDIRRDISYYEIDDEDNDIEVIGNLYETPELITNKQ